MEAPKTIICDIDGVLLKHHGNLVRQILKKPEVLKGVKEALVEWDKKGYTIILLSGRKESTRRITEKQLSEVGIPYDCLVLGASRGARVLINDRRLEGGVDRAAAVNVVRNKGIEDLKDI